MILKTIRVKTHLSELTNCYIIEDEETKETIIIDPGGEKDKIIDAIDSLDAKVKYIYLTHCHGDHIGVVNEIKNARGGKILIHKDDVNGLKDISINLSSMIAKKIKLEADSEVEDNELINVGKIKFEVIHTPGHTIGSSALYCENEEILFSGDTLFLGTYGRTDLPTSSFESIVNSIKNKLLILPEKTVVYPGHGKVTNIGIEKSRYL